MLFSLARLRRVYPVSYRINACHPELRRRCVFSGADHPPLASLVDSTVTMKTRWRGNQESITPFQRVIARCHLTGNSWNFWENDYYALSWSSVTAQSELITLDEETRASVFSLQSASSSLLLPCFNQRYFFVLLIFLMLWKVLFSIWTASSEDWRLFFSWWRCWETRPSTCRQDHTPTDCCNKLENRLGCQLGVTVDSWRSLRPSLDCASLRTSTGGCSVFTDRQVPYFSITWPHSS